jgi:hypothetical protein
MQISRRMLCMLVFAYLFENTPGMRARLEFKFSLLKSKFCGTVRTQLGVAGEKSNFREKAKL